MYQNLPARHEFIALETPQCPQCGLSLKPFPGTKDSEVLAIEVKAYRRVIHRKRYVPTCQCGCLSGIVTAPTPTRLIAKGKFGISVWTHVLLDKFLYARPSQRPVQELAAPSALSSRRTCSRPCSAWHIMRESALASAQLVASALKVLQSMAVHWRGLTVFVDYPWVPIDNNLAERDMRGPVVGRKNFYGSGAQWSGELATAMYSVLATLKLWGSMPTPS